MKRRSILVLLGVIGSPVIFVILTLLFWLGPHSVQQIAAGAFEVSEPADVKNAIELTNKYLSLQYPGNWRIDTSDPDYDPDRNFDINAPAQGKVLVCIFPPHDTPQQNVDAIVNNLKKIVMDEKKTSFDSWGVHEGYGVQLAGLIVGFNGRIRTFGFGNSEATVVIVEIRYDEDETNNKDGYKLISQTLKLKDF